MGRIEKYVIRFFAVITALFVTAGIVFVWRTQGTALMARQRVRTQSGSLMGFMKNDSEHTLELLVPVRHRASGIKCVTDSNHTGADITIPRVSASYFADFPVSGNGKDISRINYRISGSDAIIHIETSSPLFIRKKISGDRILFDFVSFEKYFDRIVVVDASDDIGTSIVKKIKAFTNTSDGFSTDEIDGVGRVGFFYTGQRMSVQDKVSYARKLDADLLLSVRMNSTSSGRRSSMNGAQVLYRASDSSEKSGKFARVIQKEMLAELGCNDRGVIAGDEEYLISASTMPVALAEPGFITNTKEAEKLGTESYQQKTAEALYKALTAFLEDKE